MMRSELGQGFHRGIPRYRERQPYIQWMGNRKNRFVSQCRGQAPSVAPAMCVFVHSLGTYFKRPRKKRGTIFWISGGMEEGPDEARAKRSTRLMRSVISRPACTDSSTCSASHIAARSWNDPNRHQVSFLFEMSDKKRGEKLRTLCTSGGTDTVKSERMESVAFLTACS